VPRARNKERNLRIKIDSKSRDNQLKIAIKYE
jgi:hypothetical protein